MQKDSFREFSVWRHIRGNLCGAALIGASEHLGLSSLGTTIGILDRSFLHIHKLARRVLDMQRLTESFRVVHGKVARDNEALPLPALKPAPALLDVHAKAPQPPLRSPSTTTKGKWTTQENDRLSEAVYMMKTSPGRLRWKDVAETVKTRGARQCSYHWHYYLNPGKEAPTPVRKKRLLDVSDFTDKATRNATRVEDVDLDELSHPEPDASMDVFATSFGAEFNDAIGDMDTDFGPESPHARRKRRLCFDPNTPVSDFEITNSVDLINIINSFDFKQPKTGLTVKVVQEISYKPPMRSSGGPLWKSSDRFALKGVLADINSRVSAK